MPRVAIASISEIAARAGAEAADAGGNAVDSGVAAALAAAATTPAMCSLGGGGFATVWPPEGRPVTIDGAHEMPGRGLPADRLGRGRIDVHMEYGGGVNTVVGPGSVATPGALAACGLAAARFGRLEWGALVEPSRRQAEAGFPLPSASHNYLQYAHQVIYGWNPDSRAALHDDEGGLLPPESPVRVPHLASTLRGLAEHGPGWLYGGELGRRVCDYILEGGGILTLEDLAAYEAIERPPLRVSLDDWSVATNPAPAVGGAALAAMLLLMRGRPVESWTAEDVAHLAKAQRAVLDYRKRHLEGADDAAAQAERLLRLADAGKLRLLTAPSTVHTSAVDSDGLACAITLSDGYGSGVMPPGTGLWMNNALGEAELNPRGYHGWPTGRRIPSNMAPTIARRTDGAVLAIGSPGADRITTAILQTLVNFIQLRMPLDAALDHPRLHVEREHGSWRVAYETGLPVEALEWPTRRFEGRSMFFGGVAAALWSPGEGFEVAADTRRGGGTALGGRA